GATRTRAGMGGESIASASGESAGIVVPMVVVTLDVLFAEFGSDVVAPIVAVFVVLVPAATPDGTLKTNGNVALAPAANVAIVQVMAPVPPAGGVMQEKTGPVCCDAEAKVMLGGTLSVSVTVVASDGPAFAAVTV